MIFLFLWLAGALCLQAILHQPTVFSAPLNPGCGCEILLYLSRHPLGQDLKSFEVGFLSCSVHIWATGNPQASIYPP